MKMLRQRFIVFWFVLLMLSNLLVLNTDNAKGPTVPCGSTLGLDQPTQTANVSPGSSGYVEFSGTVSVCLNSATTAVVTLTAEDTWNSAKVTPEAIQFSSTDRGDKVFRVSVQAPPGSSSSTVGQVIVKGTVVFYPSAIKGTVQPRDGVVGRIDIEPYYNLSSIMPTKFLDADYGRQYVSKLIIQNKGNTPDKFSVTITNYEELKKEDYSIGFKQRSIHIPEHSEKELKIFLNTPISIYESERIEKIRVKIESENHSLIYGKELSEQKTFLIRLGYDEIFGFHKQSMICCGFIFILFALILVLMIKLIENDKLRKDLKIKKQKKPINKN